MSVRSCRVTIQDLDGTSNTAEVTASSLFEAVAQGLSALRKNEWVEGIEERFGTVKASVAEVHVARHSGLTMPSCGCADFISVPLRHFSD